MAAHTSEELVEWLQVIEEEEWTQRSKQDHYLAQIATAIRQIAEGFAKNPRAVSLKDCLLDFHRDGAPVPASPAPTPSRDKPAIEPGRAAVEDNPAWAQVNRQAKAVWFARLNMGLPPLE